MVRKLFTFLFLVLLFCGLMTVAGADWEFYSNAVIYRGTDKNPLTGSWTIDGTPWSFGNDGRLLGNGKVQMPGGQACFPDADGELLTGFRVVDGVTYFFNPYPVPGMQSEYNPQTDTYDFSFDAATITVPMESGRPDGHIFCHRSGMMIYPCPRAGMLSKRR